MPTTSRLRSRKSVKSMDSDEMLKQAGQAANFLKAIANDQRLAILCTLLEGPQSVGQINERVHVSQSALSQHLAILREQELVMTEKQAQTVYYTLSDTKTEQLLHLLHEHFCT